MRLRAVQPVQVCGYEPTSANYAQILSSKRTQGELLWLNLEKKELTGASLHTVTLEKRTSSVQYEVPLHSKCPAHKLDSPLSVCYLLWTTCGDACDICVG
jgi:hypothetical protein